MTKEFDTPNYGKVTVRNAMLEGQFNDLNEGIEIKGDEIDLIEIEQYYDVDELSEVAVETLIELNS